MWGHNAAPLLEPKWNNSKLSILPTEMVWPNGYSFNWYRQKDIHSIGMATWHWTLVGLRLRFANLRLQCPTRQPKGSQNDSRDLQVTQRNAQPCSWRLWMPKPPAQNGPTGPKWGQKARKRDPKARPDGMDWQGHAQSIPLGCPMVST